MDRVQHFKMILKQLQQFMELGLKDKRDKHVTTGKSKLQLKAYEVSPKPQRICEFNPQRSEAITVQQVKNELADSLSILSKAGDYKIKVKIFLQACPQMNLNPTIDLFSQYFNNLLPRFMSTIREHREIAIDALNQTLKKEFPWIHPPIPLYPAVLKKIREEQIEAMKIAPIWPGQIWYTELVNENAQSLMLGWSNEILEPGTSLIKKNLKLPPGKICCFLTD
ncbi:MAG: hypothetical protein EZS28_023535 [Streblomastix strix]|uniref:Uncharacterized protein n=1 Tax=Streblomastix strix TaxID=222440 RepID=A0A5J4VEQ7_9EUKA|nr:MAG: hypothetical protein EZS28_023535 [Streblomastix strix]